MGDSNLKHEALQDQQSDARWRAMEQTLTEDDIDGGCPRFSRVSER